MRVELDELLARDEAVDPHEVAALGVDALREGVHLCCDLRRVRAARNEHHLVARVELQGCGEEQRQALLPRDPAVEERERPVRVDAEPSERLR